MKKGLIQVWLLGFILTGYLYGGINTGPYLTPGSNPRTSVWVNWNTNNAAQSRVAYGTSSSALNDTASSSGTTEFHHVLLDNLNPGTVYYYKVLPSGNVKYFRTFPNSADSFNFIAFGDTRDGDNPHEQIMNRMWSYDFVLVTHSGDLVGSGSSWSDWTTFFNIEDTVISYKQFLPAVGNHESPFTQFDSLFKLPEGSNNNYYSLDYGNAHFVVLNTEMNSSGISAESTWLVNDLQAANNNSNIVWKFANFHRPPYSSGPHGSASDIRAKWCPVLEEYGVDIVFNGHDHLYERSIDINGTVYIVTGGGGAPLYNGDSSWWTAYSEGTYHFCLIEIRDDDLLLKAIKRDGTVFDTLRLHKPIHEPWIKALSYNITDPPQGGNGNGILEPGETGKMVVNIKNIGGAGAYNTTGTLVSYDNYVTVQNTTYNFGDLAPGDTTSNSGSPFSLVVHDLTPQGHGAKIGLVLHADGKNDTVDFDDTLYYTITIGTPPDPTIIFGDDFEYSGGVDSFPHYWNATGNWARSTQNSHSSSHSAYSGAPLDNATTLTMKNGVDLTPFSDPRLSFWHRYDFASAMFMDGCAVQISTNGGSSWGDLWTFNWNNGETIPWTEFALPLSSYISNNVKVRFMIDANTMFQDRTDWFIDDFMLFTPTDNEPPYFTNTTVWPDTNYTGPFPVQSKITDKSGVDQAKLYYRVNSGSWQELTMSAGSNNIYSASIPAQSSGDKIDYYLWARDKWLTPNAGCDPIGAPDRGYYSFNLKIGINEGQAGRIQFMPIITNPTRGPVKIRFSIPEKNKVNLAVYDVTGRKVKTIFNKKIAPGEYQITWNRLDEKHRQISTGIYFLKFSVPDAKYEKIEKVVLLK